MESWDERYARGDELHGFAPSPPLPDAVQGLTPGLALDLACGAGRHAIFLASLGWRVQALDSSSEGLKRMMAEAQRRGLGDRIEPQIVDLQQPGACSLLPETFDLVCNFYFLHRPLLAQARRLVRPGGRFAAAVHVRTSPEEKGRFLLQPGELSALFDGWEILHFREGAAGEGGHRHGTAELIARRPVS